MKLTREQAIKEVKHRYAEYLRPAKKKGFICPICQNGTGEDGTGIDVIPGSDGQLKCFKCGMHGDIFDFYQEEHKCTTGEAFRGMFEFFRIEIIEIEVEYQVQNKRPDQRTQEKPQEPPQEAAQGPSEPLQDKPVKDYSEYFRTVRENLKGAQEYLSFRGISMTTAKRYWLGFDSAWISPTAREKAENEGKRLPPPSPRLIIPTSSHSYLARDIRPNLEGVAARYAKMKEGAVELFNTRALYNEEGRAVFVTEGELNALSIIEVGGEATALGMAGNWKKFLELMEEKPTKSTLILCLDDDRGKDMNTGARAQESLRDGLEKLNIPYIIGTSILLGENDPNDALKKDRAAFTAAVAEAEHRTAARPDNVKDYIMRLLDGEIERFKSGAQRKTGFSNLDEKISIYPGLYVLGATSSLGKTTFVLQLADQMAANGEDVLYFSLEQSRLELVSKSIARITAQTNVRNAVSALAIRGGYTSKAVLEAVCQYSDMVGERMSIIEGNFRCDLGYIKEYVRNYMKMTGTKPTVVLDYLQILQGDPRQTTREAIDTNVTELKRLSRANDIPVIVISSLNRQNYLVPVDYESFKESGCIEYSADCVLGLQLSVITDDPTFDKEGNIKKKRELIRIAKAEPERKVELVCLKNRYGVSSFRVGFSYYPAYDLFRPRTIED